MCNATKPLYWMPYFRFSTNQYRVDSFNVGQARILPDTEETWENEVQHPRPPWCKVYKNWPHTDEQEIGPSLEGTIIISDDFGWLTNNIHFVAAILYFMARQTSGHQLVAERFRYFKMEGRSEYSDMVTYWTKKGPLIQDATRLSLLPPVELRDPLNSIQLRPTDAMNAHLVDIFSSNSNHRLVAGCYYYFRAQFSDPYVAPFDQDYATYCACLEAIFNLDSMTGNIRNAMANAIEEYYGKDSDLREWIQGLYVSRSVHVHGISIEDNATGRNVELYDSFHGQPVKYSLLESICWDLLCWKIEESRLKPDLFVDLYESPKLIDIVFRSSEIWQKLKSLLTQDKAADTIETRIDSDVDGFLDEFEPLFLALPDRFDWQCVENSDAQTEHVKESIKTVCMVIGYLTNNAGSDYEAINLLGTAAIDNDDEEAIGKWACEHQGWKRPVGGDKILDTMKQLAWTLASCFHPVRY